MQLFSLRFPLNVSLYAAPKSDMRFVCTPLVSEKNMIRIVHQCQMFRETALIAAFQTLSKDHLWISWPMRPRIFNGDL